MFLSCCCSFILTLKFFCSCSSASCVRMALGTADVRESATPEAQQRRAAAVVAGRQSDGDKDKRRVPSNFVCINSWLRKLSLRTPAGVRACPDSRVICASARLKDSAGICRTDLERTCPSKLEGVYEYTALVERWYDDGLYASFPDIRVTGVEAATIEDVTRDLKVITLKHIAMHALHCCQPLPPLHY